MKHIASIVLLLAALIVALFLFGGCAWYEKSNFTPYDFNVATYHNAQSLRTEQIAFGWSWNLKPGRTQ